MSAPSESQTKVDATRRNFVWLVIQMFARTMFAIWFRYRVRGLENVPQRGPALLLVNHQSYLDPLFVPLWLCRPVSYVARDNLFKVPVVGRILRSTHVIPINRDSPGKSSVVECIKRLDEGFLVGIFPEGTRSRDGSVGKFRPGFLAILRRCDVPVIPVGIAGAYQAMPRGSILIRPRSVRVVIGAPIPADQRANLDDRDREKELIEFVRNRVVSCQDEAERWRQSKGRSDA